MVSLYLIGDDFLEPWLCKQFYEFWKSYGTCCPISSSGVKTILHHVNLWNKIEGKNEKCWLCWHGIHVLRIFVMGNLLMGVVFRLCFVFGVLFLVFLKTDKWGALLTWQSLARVWSRKCPWEGSWRGVEYEFGLKLPASENEEKTRRMSLKEVRENWVAIVREGDRVELEAENRVVWEKSGELECESAGVGGVGAQDSGAHLKSNLHKW